MQSLHERRKVYADCMAHVQLQKIERTNIEQLLASTPIKAEVFIKDVPGDLLKPFWVVSKTFPELTKTDITLRQRPISMTMQARPDIWALLFNRRKYFIFSNTKKSKNGCLFEDIPLRGQVGILAHEVAHILDYHYKSNWEIIKTGLWYLKNRNQEDYEKAIDFLVIEKGLSIELKSWMSFILKKESLRSKYRKTKEHYYLNPEEIDQIASLRRP